MQLYDYITEEERETIKDFLEIHTTATIGDLRDVLHVWNDNKGTMFKLLGKRLRYKVPVELEVSKHIYYRQLDELYGEINFRHFYGSASDLYMSTNSQHDFIEDFKQFLVQNYPPYYIHAQNGADVKRGLTGLKAHDMTDTYYMGDFFIFRVIESLFSHTCVGENEYYFTADVIRDGKKPLRLQKGSKTIRNIQKLLKYLDYPRMDLFEKWRNEISDLTTARKIKANLVISIHPLDFLTMSDNNCGWQSCMSLTNNGSFSSTVTEMMNSNCAVITYLESVHKKYTFNYHDIPNKSYRQLFYCHKKIIASGKAYPYSSEELSLKILSVLQGLAKENLGWKYQYGPQEYKDIHCHDSLAIRRMARTKRNNHRIVMYTWGFYNDMACDQGMKYYCVRNYVTRMLKLCISGPATCFCCGKPMISQQEKEYDAVYRHSEDIVHDYYGDNTGICEDCLHNRCEECDRIDVFGKTVYTLPTRSGFYSYERPRYFYNLVCEECLKYYMWYLDEDGNKLFKRKDRANRDRDKDYHCVIDGDINYAEEFRKIPHSDTV